MESKSSIFVFLNKVVFVNGNVADAKINVLLFARHLF
jgi:hypothetical protein